MKKMTTFLMFTLIFVGWSYAQRVEGLAGFLKGGYMNAPASAKTFTQIAPAGITGFANNYYLFGAEAYYRKDKDIYTVEGSMGIQQRYSYGTVYAEPYCGAAHGMYGKIIAENEQFWLYPAVGLGASVLQLSTYEKKVHKIDNIKEITLVSPSFNAGINADFLLHKKSWEKEYYYGWMLGVRAGYRASINSNNWKDENMIKPYNKPNYANNAFYLTITVGGGSFDRK